MSRPVRAAVVSDFARPMEVEELALRDPAAHEVVVRTEAYALCLTDVRQARGTFGTTAPPLVLGHSAVGVVEAVGAGVTRLRVGDRVAVPATAECGVCWFCSRGRSDQCEQHVVPGRHVADRADGTPVHAGNGTTATYATHMNLREISAFPIESDSPAEHLAMLGCGIGSGLGAVFNVARVAPGSTAAVVGAGQFGLWITQGLRVAGAERIVVVEPRADRRAIAMTLGATHVVDPADGDPVEQVRDLTAGRGVDYGFEAAGPPSAMVEAFTMTRNAGTVVVGGVTSKDAEVTFPALAFAVRGRSVHSVQNGNLRMTRDLAAFARLMDAGLLDPAPLVTGRYALDDIDAAVTAADEGRDLTGVVLPAPT